MKTKLNILATRVLLVTGLAWGITPVSARDYNMTRSQEPSVLIGMSGTALRDALGTPTTMGTYGDFQHQTWSYGVTQATPAFPGTRTMFVVELVNGRVVTASEFVITSNETN